MCHVNDVLFGDGGKVLEVFFTKADCAAASVFGEHGQAVAAANDGAGVVDEAGAPFQQGTGAKGIGMPGIVLNTTPHFRSQLLQRSGQRYGFNGIDRNMNPATVAGAPLGTGNVVFVPIQDPAAAPIHFGDQFLIVSEGLHCHLV